MNKKQERIQYLQQEKQDNLKKSKAYKTFSIIANCSAGVSAAFKNKNPPLGGFFYSQEDETVFYSVVGFRNKFNRFITFVIASGRVAIQLMHYYYKAKFTGLPRSLPSLVMTRVFKFTYYEHFFIAVSFVVFPTLPAQG